MTRYTLQENKDGTTKYVKVNEKEIPKPQEKEKLNGVCSIMPTPNHFDVNPGMWRKDNPNRS